MDITFLCQLFHLNMTSMTLSWKQMWEAHGPSLFEGIMVVNSIHKWLNWISMHRKHGCRHQHWISRTTSFWVIANCGFRSGGHFEIYAFKAFRADIISQAIPDITYRGVLSSKYKGWCGLARNCEHQWSKPWVYWQLPYESQFLGSHVEIQDGH